MSNAENLKTKYAQVHENGYANHLEITKKMEWCIVRGWVILLRIVNLSIGNIELGVLGSNSGLQGTRPAGREIYELDVGMNIVLLITDSASRAPEADR